MIKSKSALDMSDTEYRAARALAVSGKLTLAVPAAAAAPPAADALPPPAPPATGTSHTGAQPPQPNERGSGRGAMDLSPAAYKAARVALIRQIDGAHASTTDYAALAR